MFLVSSEREVHNQNSKILCVLIKHHFMKITDIIRGSSTTLHSFKWKIELLMLIWNLFILHVTVSNYRHYQPHEGMMIGMMFLRWIIVLNVVISFSEGNQLKLIINSSFFRLRKYEWGSESGQVVVLFRE